MVFPAGRTPPFGGAFAFLSGFVPFVRLQCLWTDPGGLFLVRLGRLDSHVRVRAPFDACRSGAPRAVQSGRSSVVTLPSRGKGTRREASVGGVRRSVVWIAPAARSAFGSQPSARACLAARRRFAPLRVGGGVAVLQAEERFSKACAAVWSPRTFRTRAVKPLLGSHAASAQYAREWTRTHVSRSSLGSERTGLGRCVGLVSGRRMYGGWESRVCVVVGFPDLCG